MTHEEFEALAALDVIGAASEEEQRILEAHLATCDDCDDSMRELRDAAAAFALQLEPVPPPPSLRTEILAAVAPPQIESEPSTGRGNSPAWWFATAAMLLLALWGWRELGIRSAKEALRNQTSELRQLEEQNQLLSEHNARLSAQLAAVATPGTRTIALASATGAPSASAKAFVDPAKRRAVIFFYDLPPNAGDKSYQLWIIRADRPKPQSAGTFDVANGRASVMLENLPVGTEIKGLAVTLEPRGGVEAPTAEILLSGNA